MSVKDILNSLVLISYMPPEVIVEVDDLILEYTKKHKDKFNMALVDLTSKEQEDIINLFWVMQEIIFDVVIQISEQFTVEILEAIKTQLKSNNLYETVKENKQFVNDSSDIFISLNIMLRALNDINMLFPDVLIQRGSTGFVSEAISIWKELPGTEGPGESVSTIIKEEDKFEVLKYYKAYKTLYFNLQGKLLDVFI